MQTLLKTLKVKYECKKIILHNGQYILYGFLFLIHIGNIKILLNSIMWAVCLNS